MILVIDAGNIKEFEFTHQNAISIQKFGNFSNFKETAG